MFSEKNNRRDRILSEEEETRLLKTSSRHLKSILAVALNTGAGKEADIETVRSLLSHRSILTTQRYTHTDDDKKKRAVDQRTHISPHEPIRVK